MSQTPAPGRLPPHIRPITFAGNELLLDLVHLLQSFFKRDWDSVLILLCVTDATMRPFMVQDPPPEIISDPHPPDSIRGAISRRMIADKTGLSRETVRRKTQELAAIGLLQIDSEDRIRSVQLLDTPEFQRVVDEGHKAVQRYLARLRSYRVDIDCT